MIRDRVNGHEIRVVWKNKGGLLGPPSINEFIDGVNCGLYCPAQSLNPHDVLARLLELGRINEAEHTGLTTQVDQVQHDRAHPVRVPDLKGGDEFSIGSDGLGPVIVMHHKDTNDFLRSYVSWEGNFNPLFVIGQLCLAGHIDTDGKYALANEVLKRQ